MARRCWYWLRLDLGGLSLAAVFFGLSLTPSLVPRTWTFQALVSGITITIGYALGVILAAVLRMAWVPVGRRWNLPRKGVLAIWWGGGIVAVGAITGYLLASAGWQTELRDLFAMASPGPAHYLQVVALSFGGLLVFIGLWRVLRWGARRLSSVMSRRVPPRLALGVASLLVGAVFGFALNGVLVPSVLGAVNDAFGTLNREGHAARPAPESTLRSGGTDSLVNWSEMGREGRALTGGGPTVADLRDFVSRTDPSADLDQVQEPIRVYAGLGGTQDMRTRARQVVAELERTGAFDREVLVVATATGKGWIDPVAIESLEYMHRGDTAFATMQYSYVPSAISFLVDITEAQRAGTLLFEAVEARWRQLDEQDRPKLIAYGESLGALGSAAAFDDLEDVRRRTDGALWVGAPAATELIADWKAARQPGSAMIQPIVDDGRTVRFWNRHGPAGDPINGPWPHPRVIVLQHPSDPVVWWSTDLLLSEPEWMREPSGDDVLPTFAWHPFVTFWQVAADMAGSGNVPYGYAHRYGDEQIQSWSAITAPNEWSDQWTDELAELVVP
ncbi:MAG TPA: alpha/beta-hydrolase family protein [Jiangellaceae bacterium]|nr:alpha/beta-hydrolase family protein [Jiangellaceae bacterium]